MNPECSLSLPSRYQPKTSGPPLPASTPPLDFLTTTWAVTHSTLAMWRTARNVRITYTLLPAKPNGRPRLDDLVEYEDIPKPGKKASRKSVHGVDVQADDGGWDWRGKGMLVVVGSHWEVLGWGETRDENGRREMWAVTWFAPTLLTKEGVDVYCSSKEGISEATYAKILESLKKLDSLADLIKDMRPVEIQLPWVTE